uniref:RBR-type E3 ubiquitin transferase n=1 Tax=Buteo japonicus TaxID=224669 RepID=A0A8C0BJ12_9AVES
ALSPGVAQCSTLLLEEPEEMSITLPLGEGGELVECPLCLLPQPPEAFPTLASCDHRSCRACLEQYLRIAVSESRVQVACPHCPAALQPADVHHLLAEPALRDKYEEFLLRRLLVADPGTRWCPAPDCSYAVIAYGCAECPRLTCGREGCGTEFCYHCRQPWVWGWTCTVLSCSHPSHLISFPPSAEAEDIKVCPRCSAFIMKINDGSCNRMNCTVCGCLFCWLCLQEITDVHFLRSVQRCGGTGCAGGAGVEGLKVLAGGPGVPMVPLPAKPGSPWRQAWTDMQCSPLPTACPCATPDCPQPLLAGTLSAAHPSTLRQ